MSLDKFLKVPTWEELGFKEETRKLKGKQVCPKCYRQGYYRVLTDGQIQCRGKACETIWRP